MASSGKASSKSMALANNHLAVHLHRLLAEEKANVFFSPFSISIAMAMVLCAAEGETEAELRKVLGYDLAGISKQDVASTSQQLMSDLLQSQNSYILTTANSLLTQKDFQVKNKYKSVLEEFFKALLLEVDFQNNSAAAIRQINDWVKMETNGMIPNLVESLDSNTVMVLLNAVYFKGNWLRKFDENLTSSGKFFNNGDLEKSKSVKMMDMKETFLFAENASFKSLQLPYVGENIAMLILLPHNNDGLCSLEAELVPSFIEELRKNMRKRKVNVIMPRFRLEYSKSMVSIFQRLGIKKLFSSSADLGSASDSADLSVSDIIHKAVLEINEEGSEAAAVTMVIMARCAIRQEPIFRVDHPFAFVIYDTKSNFILFMGRVEEL